ncbi:MAG: hypothetical protein KZQ58_11110 [gamma proteobacterium symbiont of Bathyaustriella thionipta]|nr:hypothetical protein [gamma proteobacterium symbiont of Bathyaustriella thionipta]
MKLARLLVASSFVVIGSPVIADNAAVVETQEVLIEAPVSDYAPPPPPMYGVLMGRQQGGMNRQWQAPAYGGPRGAGYNARMPMMNPPAQADNSASDAAAQAEMLKHREEQKKQMAEMMAKRQAMKEQHMQEMQEMKKQRMQEMKERQEKKQQRMQEMQKHMAMKQQHMEKMEAHLANIEALLQKLVDALPPRQQPQP